MCWGWYSGQNETPSGEYEKHLGNLYKKWAKVASEMGKTNSILLSWADFTASFRFYNLEFPALLKVILPLCCSANVLLDFATLFEVLLPCPANSDASSLLQVNVRGYSSRLSSIW